MARMVFGTMTEAYAAPQAEHFIARKLEGEKTACGVTYRSGYGRSAVRSWKDWRMVTCKRCLAKHAD